MWFAFARLGARISPSLPASLRCECGQPICSTWKRMEEPPMDHMSSVLPYRCTRDKWVLGRCLHVEELAQPWSRSLRQRECLLSGNRTHLLRICAKILSVEDDMIFQHGSRYKLVQEQCQYPTIRNKLPCRLSSKFSWTAYVIPHACLLGSLFDWPYQYKFPSYVHMGIVPGIQID
jgi:hypothetical protein